MAGRTVELEGVASILIERSKRAKRISISIRRGRDVRVAVPYGVSFDRAQEFAESRISWIKKHIQKVQKATPVNVSEVIDKNQARMKIISRLKALSAKHRLPYNRLFIRNQKTRWGSCSAKNNISMNIRIFLLPDKYLDYVILHELVHTQIKNHNPKFWQALDRLVGDAKKMDRRLNDYQLL